MKNLKNGPKSGRENEKMPVKKPKKRPKIAFTGTFYFHGEKIKLLKTILNGGEICRNLCKIYFNKSAKKIFFFKTKNVPNF